MNTTDQTISSAANPVVKQIRALDQKKHRDETGLFLVEGLRHVSEALLAGWLPVLVLTTPALRNDNALRRLLAGQQAKRYEVTAELMGRITGRDNAEDVLAAFQQNFATLDAAREGLWVGLEDVRDPGNLGTILRSAEAAGATGILLIGSCCDAFSPEAVRASVGSFSRMKIVKISQAAFIEWARTYKGQIIGTQMNAPLDYRKAEYQLPAVVLMGSEHAGLSPMLFPVCTATVKIPMRGQIESLNVATATALLLFEVNRSF